MRDVVYLIVNPQAASRIVHHLDAATLHHDERPLKIVVNVPNSYFVPKPMPSLEVSVPDQDMLAGTEVEVTATLIPEQETA